MDVLSQHGESPEYLPEYVDTVPNLSGSETLVESAIDASRGAPLYHGATPADINGIDAAFAVALHMHQPLIPAATADLRTADIIGNLQWMQEHLDIGDNHNAPVFRWCYQRMAEFVPQLLAEGYQPRVMLEYSGTLLHGLRRMGADDVLEALRRITCEPDLRQAVEWVGCAWGHPVAPSTPVQDYRLHVRAWQHHFAAIFGLDALGRVRGFSPAEMALPNHPDVAYEFVRTLKDSGYEWVLVQEHTVESLDGHPVRHPHLPHRLVCNSSRGETAEIVAVVKTQGSDTKLVAQMQPYYEAKGLHPVPLAGRMVPPLVTQIADGENGGVMMNEFPPKYLEVIRECSGSRTPAMNVTEYLEGLFATGVRPSDLPQIQPALQHRVWQHMAPGDGPARVAEVIEQLRAQDNRFNVEGGSWTSDVSWVRGYDNILAPMEKASSLFHDRVTSRGVPTDDPRYRAALFHLLAAETSCYRYWGQGIWTEYGAELSRRAIDSINRLG
jgi:glycosyl hydrolase family 57